MLQKVVRLIVSVGYLAGLGDASEDEKFQYAFNVARESAPKGCILEAKRINKSQIEVTIKTGK